MEIIHNFFIYFLSTQITVIVVLLNLMFVLNPKNKTENQMLYHHCLLELIVDLGKSHKFDLLEFSSWLNLMQEL